jgi:hypothetical protein
VLPFLQPRQKSKQEISLHERMSGQQPPRRPPQLPKEEPAIPLEPGVASARTTYIRQNLDEIKRMQREGKTIDEIRAAHTRFAEDYPQIFKMVTKGESYDEASLRTMLHMLERMGTGEITQHQASVIIGQRLHDKFIQPALDAEKKH